MPKRKRKSDLYKRAEGYGLLHAIAKQEADDALWKPVPGFPEYEVNARRQVRRITTGYDIQPYRYAMRPHEGEFVDFWINGQKHIVSLDAIMTGAFKND
jgi:hypothetical protein